MHNSFIMSTTEYRNVVWEGTYEVDTQKLEKYIDAMLCNRNNCEEQN